MLFTNYLLSFFVTLFCYVVILWGTGSLLLALLFCAAIGLTAGFLTARDHS